MPGTMLTTAELWDEFHHEIRRFILRRVADPDDAEDLVQEIFIKIHTRIDQLQNNERLVPWLYQIARNTIIDYYRSRKTYLSIPENLIENQITVMEDEDNVEGKLAKGLQGMINQLDEKYRLPLEMVELQGIKQKDVAEKLGISISGAKSRIQRGREKLRQLLLDCCHFEFDRRQRILEYIPKQNCCQRCNC